MDRFVSGDWTGMQADTVERLDAYQKILQQVVTDLAAAPGPRSADCTLWIDAKTAFTSKLDQVSDPDLAETFFNSVTRRLGNIIVADPQREFLHDDPRPLPAPRDGRDVISLPAADRFAQPERTTRREVIAKYDYIFRHDRTGRLPDTQSLNIAVRKSTCGWTAAPSPAVFSVLPCTSFIMPPNACRRAPAPISTCPNRSQLRPLGLY